MEYLMRYKKYPCSNGIKKILLLLKTAAMKSSKKLPLDMGRELQVKSNHILNCINLDIDQFR